MRSKTFICFFILISSGLAFSAEPKWVKQAPANDDEYYYEVGSCEYTGDALVDSARMEAIKQAKFSFYNNIASDFIKLLNKELSIDLKGEVSYYAKYLNEFVYNSPLDTLIEEQDAFDFNQKKIYYVLMRMPKQKYRQKINEVIQGRVKEINDMMKDLFGYLNQKNQRKSLELLMRVFDKKEQYFPGLAMTVSNLEELNGVQVDDYIRGNLNELLSSLVFETDDEIFRYDYEGKLMEKPLIHLKYIDCYDNETLNMQNVPVRIIVENGSKIEIDERIITTSEGKVNFPNKTLKNDNSVYVMRIQLDVSKIMGDEISAKMMEKLSNFSFPEKTIEIEPVKNIAFVAVNSVISKTTDMSAGLYSSMNDIIKTKQYLLYKLQPPSNGKTSTESFNEEELKPFNYLIAVQTEGSTLEDSGLYHANVTYRCIVYELSTKTIEKEFTTGYSESWGGSKTEAVNSALEKMKNKLFKQIDNLILK